ncbi:hypothetical protein EC968_003626 [Mortierella alpina]|nr:hypothetical protein EC968_003626 [Mortierella alpina]
MPWKQNESETENDDLTGSGPAHSNDFRNSAISQRGDIRSLRDLRAEHLPLLKNIRDKILALIPTQFPGVASDEVRLFVHYHPSYYHFHVHITHVSATVAGSTVGQSHLLDTIIDNIENIDPEYYSKASIRFALGVNHALYKLITESQALQ